jgi:hypothetical protein
MKRGGRTGGSTPWQQTLSVIRPRAVQLGFRFEF